MAMPHKIQMMLIKERLKGMDGKSKLQEIEKIIEELPRYKNGPYADIRKWCHEQITVTRVRSKIKHQDWLGVKRQGIRQFVLVGPPNVGKSSLINKLSGLQTKIANYKFTTLKPLPGMVNINGAEFQIVDLPGLVEGAGEDIGGGKRLLGIVKNSDGIILMHDLTRPLDELQSIIEELGKENIVKSIILVGSKLDLARDNLKILEEKSKEILAGKEAIGVSIVTGEGLEQLREELWNMSRLIRVYPKNQGRPLILEQGSTIRGCAERIHKDLVKNFRFARVTGKSSKFKNQQLGLNHVLQDEDVIEIATKL